MTRDHRIKFVVFWVFGITAAVVIQLAANALSGQDPAGTPTLFAIVVCIAMVFGAIGATKLIVRAHRTAEVELAYYGLFFYTQAALAISHALTTSGVLFANRGSSLEVWFWSTPVALVVALPALLHRSRAGRAIDEEWKQWVTTFQFVVIAVSLTLIIAPNVLPSIPTGNTLRAVVLASVIGSLALSARHVYLATITRSIGPMMVALALVLIGSSNLIWLDIAPLSSGFWVAQFLAIFGVIIGVVATLSVYQITAHVRPFIDAMAAADPRCALPVGIDPAIHSFIADLQATDHGRVEHVLRTRDLAMTVGKKMGSTGVDLRNLGLTALLHDIGMMIVPAAILDTPGDLTDEQYEIVKRHSLYGAQILGESPILKSIAPAVRAHHERVDGKGYPYGLTGPNIPRHSRIVSVVDAFDALSNHRHYRKSLDFEGAIDVLEGSAGLQWDRRIVEIVVRTVRHQPVRSLPEWLDSDVPLGCDCMPRVQAS